MDRQQLAQAYNQLEAERNQRSEPERTTSAAKEYDPEGLKGTSLENAPNAGQAFDQARDGSRAQGDDRGVDSEQVTRDSPDHEMRPPTDIARDPDRQRHEQAMARDDANAANYEALRDGLQSRQSGSGYGQQRDGPEMG